MYTLFHLLFQEVWRRECLTGDELKILFKIRFVTPSPFGKYSCRCHRNLFTTSNAVCSVVQLVFPGIEVVVEGDALADAVILELLPHSGLWVFLLAHLAALGAVNNAISSVHDVVLCHCRLPRTIFFVSSMGNHSTWLLMGNASIHIRKVTGQAMPKEKCKNWETLNNQIW